MDMKKNIVLAAICLFFVSGLVDRAFGHAAIVWAYVKDNQVFVEAFYASGKKIQEARVVVVDKDSKTIREGNTDREGKFSYKPLSRDTQTIVVMAGESHVGDFELNSDELVDVSLK